ncbi:hypothetical protein AB0H07_46730 [Streptomyces sp. NPDC021354]|uniref:hypothetical protein n=1 Tax=Streptomyces sp. NPDC021354 TaxID=3154793 RepID=UPI0033EA486F
MAEDMTEELPETRSYRGWTAPVMSTLVTLPLVLLTLALVGISPMSCDYCQGVQLKRLEESLSVAWTIYRLGLALPIGLLLAAYIATWRRREAARLWLAFLAPPSVLIPYMLFASILD